MSESKSNSRKQLSVLLVDDSEFDYFVTKQFLAEYDDMDVDLEWARDYQEGLEYTAFGNHDLKLVDLSLLGESGFDYAERVREAGFETPMIMYSGMDPQSINWGTAHKFFQGYLPKEKLNAERMKAEVRRVFETPNPTIPAHEE